MKYNALEKAQELRHGALIHYLEATVRRYESLLEFLDAENARLRAELQALQAPLHNDEQNNR